MTRQEAKIRRQAELAISVKYIKELQERDQRIAQLEAELAELRSSPVLPAPAPACACVDDDCPCSWCETARAAARTAAQRCPVKMPVGAVISIGRDRSDPDRRFIDCSETVITLRGDRGRAVG